MPIRKAQAAWTGTLREGKGRMALASGAFEGPYSFSSRFEEGPGTNPEELIAAAHAGCFSMAFAADLGRAGHSPEQIETTAELHLEKLEAGFSITRIILHTEASIPGIEESEFLALAQNAKAHCPVSRALSGVEIELRPRLR